MFNQMSRLSHPKGCTPKDAPLQSYTIKLELEQRDIFRCLFRS